MADAFTPTGATTNLAVTATTGASSISAVGATLERTVRFYNAGAVVVFIAFGVSTITVTASNGVPIPPGAVEYFTVPGNVTHVAAITSAGTATIYMTEGNGQ